MLGRAVELLEGSDGVELIREEWLGPREAGERVRRAAADGVDCVVAAGGDGTVNSVATGLVGSAVPLGILPSGSGNGFARHFGIPLDLAAAARVVIEGSPRGMDVGWANGRPFFVTCSFAWDASMVRAYRKMPVRGVLPYFAAGAADLLLYRPSRAEVVFDGGEALEFPDPLLLTAANLSQFGGGARIAPQAKADDGLLEWVAAARKDLGRLLGSMPRLFGGRFHESPGVVTRRFRSLVLRRGRDGPVQMDGELVDMPGEISIRVQPSALRVMAP